MATLFDPVERAFVEAVARLAFANPFGPERVRAERDALGPQYVDTGALWTPPRRGDAPRENAQRIRARLTPLISGLRERIAAGVVASKADLVLYQEACLYFLYDRYAERLRALCDGPPGRVDFYDEFAEDRARLGDLPGVVLAAAAHLFACAFQIRRAHHHIASQLVGGSPPAARLRAHVWESIVTHNLRRYLRSAYLRMDEIVTLVVGASGTGKERVARAIGLSLYVPFDAGPRRFTVDHAASFHALNLAALAPSVVESELFGHRRGSFTGAVADKQGWFALGGAIFLDEIGEVDKSIQVKLLRVIQERRFQPVGGIEDEVLVGKLIAATHQNLAGLTKNGAFRLDLYMRIRADQIATPSLREMLDAAPGERRALVQHLAEKVIGPDDADALTDEVEAWIEATHPPDYAWPGNVRELEQCVRSRLVHHSCRPLELAPASAPSAAADDDGEAEFVRAFREGKLTAAAALRRQTTVVQALTGSIRETARRLGIDRRVVTQNVDPTLLAELVARRRRSGAGEDTG